MATGAGQDRWSSEIQSSLEDLTVKSLDELMKLMIAVSGFIPRDCDRREEPGILRPSRKQEGQIRYGTAIVTVAATICRLLLQYSSPVRTDKGSTA